MTRKFVRQKLLLLIFLTGGTASSFSQITSNKGREFWVGYGHHQFMESGSNAMNMRLYLSTEDQPATVTVTIDSSGNPFIPPPLVGSIWTRTYTLAPYTAIQTDIIPKGTPNVAAAAGDVPSDPQWDARLWSLPPASGGTGGSGIFRRKGIHIVSNVPITAYAHIYGSASSGATMLMPVTAWGYEYVSLNSNQSYAQNCYNWTYVIASKDNTVIEITPSVKTRGQNRTGLSPGVTHRDTLMKGQIYQLIGANLNSDVFGNGGTSSSGYSLSGTKIKSIAGPSGECYPIAVFAGSSRTLNAATCGTGGGDNDNQQLFPYHAWGKKYLTAPFSGSATASNYQTSIVKITFTDPTTVVKRNGTVIPLPPGDLFYTYESNTADLIESDKPIMVNQYMTGGSCSNGPLGDPEMVVVAPVEQAIKQVTFYRQSRENIQVNYLTLIVPTEGLASLRIDNSGVFDLTYPHPRNALIGKNYTVVVKRWDIGAGQGYQCYVKCDSAFNAITYGLGSVESYAYSAGAYINNLNALTGIHNQPDTTNGGNSINLYTGVGTPMDLSILIKYKPDRLTWKFSELLPAACWTASPSISGDFVMNPASTYLVDSPIIDGIKYYRYELPQTFTFNCVGQFEVPVEAYSPGINSCGNTETFYPAIEVRDQPVIDYTYLHTTQCTKDTIYLTGPDAGLSGTTPMLISQWKWLLPGGITAGQRDTAIVLPAGTHTIRLVGVSDQGLLTDTIVKTITVFPPPTTVLSAVPDVVCLGQSVAFSQVANYGAPAVPITNYYWDFGDGNTANGLVTTQSHTYASSNTYIAKAVVKVSDLCVGDTAQKTVIVSPEAKIDFTYPVGCLPTTGLAQFSASATDLGGTPITSYSWDFGDPGSGANNTSTAQNPTHTYATFGSYDVTLTVTNSTGCSGDTTISIQFSLEPALNFLPLSSVCVSAAPYSVDSASVTNGVSGTGAYSGPGITNATTGAFDPSLAGPGTHTITFTYTTPDCFKTITQTITVNPLPSVDGGVYSPLCTNSAAIPLNGTPAGGTFSGPGVSGTNFDPAVAGAGTHNIVYSYVDPNGCSNVSNFSITVHAAPTVNAGTYSPACINGGIVVLNGTPAGGTFTGPGVSGLSFDPVAAGTGTHNLSYSYSDPNGCSGTANATIVVNPAPVVNAGTYGPVCADAGNLNLNGTPTGGTFSGPGVAGNIFDPAIAGAGSHIVTYTVTDANGCNGSAQTTIVVNAVPVVNAGTYTPVCISAGAIGLNGSPIGGTFSGTGVSGVSFDPAVAGAGTHTITYSYTSASGCLATATANIIVNALPVVNGGTYSPVCVNGAVFPLNGTPVGGSFTGTGVSGGNFDPAVAGTGTHNLTYSFTDANGCTNTAMTSVTVNALPVVNAGTYAAVCISPATIPLNGTPAGGTFSGPGVSGNDFSPSTAGAGTHTLTYSYTDGNGCAATANTTITVNATPVVNAGSYTPLCVSNAAIPLNGSPAGGVFSGPGVSGLTFDPAVAGPGTHNIDYSFTNASGCAATASATITVNALPVVNAGIDLQVCMDAAPFTLNGIPVGGTFTGPGVTANSFNPATAGTGTHTVTYTFIDANGCGSSDDLTITVNLVPTLNAGTYPAVCVNSASFPLNGTPLGGTFTGPGVSGNSFNPATAGVGSHTITYGNVAGCNNTTATSTIVVNGIPAAPTAGSPVDYCEGAAASALTATALAGHVLTWYNNAGLTGGSSAAPVPSTATAGATTYYVTQTSAAGCESPAVTITVNVFAALSNNTVTGDQTICTGTASAMLTGGTPTGGTGGYSYQWQQSTDGGATWADIASATSANFDAGVLTTTTMYRRVVTSGLCSNASNPVTITVLVALGSFNLSPDQTICEGSVPALINGQSATGGTGAYTYEWESSVDGVNWTVIAGATGEDYQPPALSVTTHFRRKVTSGPCSVYSVRLLITVTALPMASITGPATVCEYNAGDITFNATTGTAPFSVLISVSGPSGTVNLSQSIPGNGPATINAIPANSAPGNYSITISSITDNNGCLRTGGFTPIVINVAPRPVVNAGTYNAACVNGANLALNGTPAGGTFTGTGVSANSFYPSTAGAGSHVITYAYSDNNGCSNTATTTISVNPLPVVNAGTYQPVCVDAGTVGLSGSPVGGTFSGPGVTGPAFDPGTAGAGPKTITYTYTDGNGCTNTATTDIIVNALPVVNAGPFNAQCVSATSYALTGSPAGGTFSGPGVSANNFDASVAGVGTHNLNYTFTDANGCTNSASAVAITVNPLPVVSAGTYNPLCEGDALLPLAGSPAGGTYSGPGVSGVNFDPASAGPGSHSINYSYTDANGCSNTATPAIVVVNPRPQASFAVTPDVCLNQSLTVTPAATIPSGNVTSWNWDLGNGTTPSYPNGNAFAVNYAAAQAYTLQLVAVSDMGCASLPVTKSVNVHPLPVADFQVPTKICLPGSASFVNQSSVNETNNALTYYWDFGDGSGSSTDPNPAYSYAAAGSYSVTLTAVSAFGCQSASTSKLVDDFYDKPSALFYVAPTEICQGQNLVFDNQSSDPNGSTLQSWNWAFSDNSSSADQVPLKNFNVPGTYTITLTVTNAAGCKSDPYQLPVTVHLQPVIDAGRSFVVPQGTPIQFEGVANSQTFSFSWTPSGTLTDPSTLRPTLVANADQKYILTAIGDFGCFAQDSLLVKILKPVNVPNAFTPNGDGIHDRWDIPNLADYPGCSVEIFNRYGQQVFRSSGYGTPWDGRYRGADLPVGTYYYVIKLENGFKPVTGWVAIIR